MSEKTLASKLKKGFYNGLAATALSLGSLIGFDSIRPKEAQAQEQYVAAFNIGAGCIMSGLIGKKEDNRSFLEKCAYGSLGGLLVYSGMKMVTENPGLGPIGQLTNSLGVSIWENQLQNREPFEQYRFFLGPLDIRYNFKNNDLETRILAGTTLAILRSIITKEQFLGETSLQTMTPVFELKERANSWSSGSQGMIVMGPLEDLEKRGPPIKSVLGHELVHVLQYRRFGLLSTAPELEKLEKKYKISFGQDVAWGAIVFPSIATVPSPEYYPLEMEAFAFIPASYFDKYARP